MIDYRAWLTTTFAADVDVIEVEYLDVADERGNATDRYYPANASNQRDWLHGPTGFYAARDGNAPHRPTRVDLLPACRCYRCGMVMTVDQVHVALINPAGSYRRNNIRPACVGCHAWLQTGDVVVGQDVTP